ncbi:MAG: peptide deformylase [Candidatus Margulisiibacteriota bacterium]
MAVLTILTQGNPVLKKKSKAIGKILPEIKKLIDNMEDTMRAAPGVGLAAPQIGALKRVIVADIGEGLIALINPKILKRSGKCMFYEGCLSVPGVEGQVERSESIRVKGLDKNGKPFVVEAEGYLAVVLQHEIDHLEGILFVDRIKDPSRIKYRKSGKDETI